MLAVVVVLASVEVPVLYLSGWATLGWVVAGAVNVAMVAIARVVELEHLARTRCVGTCPRCCPPGPDEHAKQ